VNTKIIGLWSFLIIVMVGVQPKSIALSLINFVELQPINFPQVEMQISRTRSITEFEQPSTRPQESSTPPKPNPARDKWALKKLLTLIERYNCVPNSVRSIIASYHKKSLTRFEMAAMLLICKSDLKNYIVPRNDLTIAKDLQAEFGYELNTLKNRVDSLE
jgi:hypothetical protein